MPRHCPACSYGDGTSVFDAKWHYDPKTYKPNQTNCARMGHWYPVTGKPCVDCGEYQARSYTDL